MAHRRRAVGARTHQVLAQSCERLLGCGIPLWRVAVFVRTLHPNIPGRAFVWRRGEEVQVRPADFELFESEEFRNSPVAAVYQRGIAIRRRLADPDCPSIFPSSAISRPRMYRTIWPRHCASRTAPFRW